MWHTRPAILGPLAAMVGGSTAGQQPPSTLVKGSILLRKNLRLKFRGAIKWCTFCETLVPVFIVSLLCIAAYYTEDEYINTYFYDDYRVENSQWALLHTAEEESRGEVEANARGRFKCTVGHTIVFTPDTPHVRQLANRTLDNIVCPTDDAVEAFNSTRKSRAYPEGPSNFLQFVDSCTHRHDWMPRFPARLRDACIEACSEPDSRCAAVAANISSIMASESIAVAYALANPGEVLAIVNFNSQYGSKVVDYTIRVNHTTMADTGTNFANRWSVTEPPSWTTQNYYTFVNVQKAVDTALIETASEREIGIAASVQVGVKPTPWLGYVLHPFGEVGALVAIILAQCFIATCIIVQYTLVSEKELRIKEGLYMMGVNWKLYWSSWFISHFILVFFTALGITAVGSYIFKYSSPAVMFIYFVLYLMSVITFGYTISAFFTTSRRAAVMGAVLYQMTISPAQIAVNMYPYGSGGWLAACLLPSGSVYIWGQAIKVLEEGQIGITFDTLDVSITDKFDVTPAKIIGITIIDIFIYAFLAWYLEHTWPSSYGQKLPPWFIFTKSFWFRDKKPESTALSIDSIEENESGEIVEPLSSSAKCSVSIRSLRKEFKKVVAVDDISLEMAEGQITALLGHNGAGKTTTISMLTGLIPIGSGSAVLNGYDVSTQMREIRRSLGVCPQFDILWPNLTVREHMILYGISRGIPRNVLQNEIRAKLIDVGLLDKLNERVSTLSGGQRRKLSLAIALLGDPKLIFLDEPTSGMDPFSRRLCWDLLRTQRSEKTIILTTHFMDEADVLADRVAIMNQGSLVCAGSTSFLKSKYGAGYTITIAMDSDKTLPPPIVQATRSFFPTAEIVSHAGTELTLSLPKSAVAEFPAYLRDLEAKGRDLEVKSYGLSCTTLEEVFLQTVSDSHSKEEVNLETPLIGSGQDILAGDMGQVEMTGLALRLQQFIVLLWKRWLNFRRDMVTIVFQLILPALFVLIGCLIMTIQVVNKNMDPIQITPVVVNNKAPVYGVSPYAAANNSQSVTSVIANIDRFNVIASGRSELCQSSCSCPPLSQDPAFVTPTVAPEDECSLALNVTRVSIEDLGEPDLMCIGLAEYIQKGCYCNGSCGFSCRNRLEDLKNFCRGRAIIPPILYCPCEQMPQSFVETSIDDYILAGDVPKRGCDNEPGACDGFFLANVNDMQNVSGRGIAPIFNHMVLSNPTSYHALPLTVNNIHSAIFRLYEGAEGNIIVRNHPIPLTQTEKGNGEDAQIVLTLVVALFIGIGMAILSASYCIFLIWERNNNAKHMQMVSGVPKYLFVLSNYTSDVVLYIIPFSLLMIVFASVPNEEFHGKNLQAIAGLLALYGTAAIPLSYLFHYPFKSNIGGFMAQLSFYSIFGIAMLLASVITEQINQPAVQNVHDILKWVFRLFPQYCLQRGIYDIGINYFFEKYSDILSPGQNEYHDLWSNEVTGYHFMFLAIESVVYLVFVVAIEYGEGWINCVADFIYGSNKNIPFSKSSDSDVIDEDRRVNSGTMDDIVVVNGLVKKYTNGITAVNNLSFGVKPGECFGLLGVNGAGKTSTFRMMTGEYLPTSGDMYLSMNNGESRYSIVHDPNAVRQHIGYCPQFDGIHPNMTATEHLRFYGAIRGVPLRNTRTTAAHLIKQLKLGKYADRLSGTYSGGNKRKLSVAIALIGKPPVVLLDEPSTGMDPDTKRFMWSVISSMKEQAVVLTSHSMEECEALCSKVGIMVGGEFQCFGSKQHLKSKLGRGYTVNALFDEENHNVTAGNLKSFMERSFPGTTVVEEHSRSITFEIPINLSIPDVFEAMEKNKSALNIEDYALSQTSLEQIFLRVAGEDVADRT